MSVYTPSRPAQRLGWHKRRGFEGYLYVLPWIAGVLFFFLYPMAYAGYISFTDWKAAGQPIWIGLRNYQTILRDPLAAHALKLTTAYTAIAVPLQMLVGIGMAYLLNQRIRGIAVFRTIYYMPFIIAGPAVAVLWSWMFNTEFGLINYLLRLWGVPEPIPWLTDPDWVMAVYVIMSVWTVGHTIVTYLAGLQSIPTDYYEAAEVDGANRWHTFWRITLPLMSPVIFYNLLIAIISSFQIFTTAFVLTQGTGRPANASLFFYLYLYRIGFGEGYLGYAAALGWLLFAILSVLAGSLIKGFGGRVFYEARAEGGA